MARARSFYEHVFKVKLQPLDSPVGPMLAFPLRPELPGCSGALVKMEGKDLGGGTIIYFSCDDCAVEAARVVEKGGQIFKAKFPIGQNGFIALFIDSEGNMIGLHSRK